MSEPWFNVKMPYMPEDRYAYPSSPFATLWTQVPEDANAAYSIYRDDLRASGKQSSSLMMAFEGRPFRCPVIDGTFQYLNQWARPRWSNEERASAVQLMSDLGFESLRILHAVSLRKRAAKVSSITYGISDPTDPVDRLISSGLCVTIDDSKLQISSVDKELIRWELDRRYWRCDLMVHYQFAIEATQSSIRIYRESGVVSSVEMLNPQCCKQCNIRYPGRIPIEVNIEIPVPGCTNESGYTCGVLPVVDVLEEL